MAILLVSLRTLQQYAVVGVDDLPDDCQRLIPPRSTLAAPLNPPALAPGMNVPLSAAETLGFAPAEVQALVERAGPDAGRLLLSLVCRIASIEAELAELRGRIGHATAAGPPPLSRSAGLAVDTTSTGRSALLEKVFQNNMMLWKLIEGDLS